MIASPLLILSPFKIDPPPSFNIEPFASFKIDPPLSLNIEPSPFDGIDPNILPPSLFKMLPFPSNLKSFFFSNLGVTINLGSEIVARNENNFGEVEEINPLKGAINVSFAPKSTK